MDRYVKHVLCNGFCKKWVPRAGLRAGQVKCDVCHQRFRTGPKTLRDKKKYDKLLVRY